jgi:hypothetical protein
MPTTSFTDTLTPAELYRRCYAHLTNEPPLESDPLLLQVKSQTITAVNACMTILDTANLNTNGDMISISETGKKVMKVMTNFHVSWFNVLNYSIYDNGESDDVFDIGSSSLYLSKALFSDTTNVNYVLTHTKTLKGIRQESGVNEYLVNTSKANRKIADQLWHHGENANPILDPPTWTPPLIQRGDLVGIKDYQTTPTTINVVNKSRQMLPLNHDLHHHFGGGLLGTNTSIALHLGREVGVPFDGAIQLPRRWSKQIFNSLMCRTLPLVRTNDNDDMVNVNSTAIFRQSGSCMSCHGSMDNLTGTIGRLMATYSSKEFPVTTNKLRTLHVYENPITQAIRSTEKYIHEISISDTSFANRPSTGSFRFRSFNGDLLDYEINNLNELGTFLTTGSNGFTKIGTVPNYDGRDFYACVAKRYFGFFTGIEIPILDYQDPNYPVLTAKDKTYRDFILTLGSALKTNQSQRTLIKSIFESAYYQDRAYGLDPLQ